MEQRRGRGQGQQWDADRVKALRDHLGLTQQQMSEELGTRQQTISEWERGIYRPRGVSRTMLNIIAEGTGFKYSAGGTEEPGSGAEAEEEAQE